MATEAEVISITFRADGQRGVVTAFDQVSSASVKSEQSVKKFDETSQRSFKNFNEAASKGARAVGVFSMAASAAEPALGKLGSAAMRTAESVMSFGSYLGGPWGIAIGAAVAAVSLLTQHLSDNKKEAEAAAEAQSKFAKASAEANFANMQAEQAALKRFNALAESVVGKPPGTPATLEEVNRIEEETRKREALLGIKSDNVGGGKRAAFKAPRQTDFTGGTGDRMFLDQQIADSQDRMARFDRMGGGIDEAKIKAAGDDARRKADLQFEKSHQDNLIAEWRRADMEKARIDQEAQERSRRTREIASNAFGAVSAAGANALNKLARGQKTSLKEFVGTIGAALVAQGTADVARAGAMFFDPLRAGFAPGLLAAAGTEIAVGMSMGAASAGGGGGGAGGASRGVRGVDYAARGESGGDYLDRTRASSPSRRGGSSSGGVTVVNQTLQVSSVVPHTEDQARALAKIVRDGALHGAV